MPSPEHIELIKNILANEWVEVEQIRLKMTVLLNTFLNENECVAFELDALQEKDLIECSKDLAEELKDCTKLMFDTLKVMLKEL